MYEGGNGTWVYNYNLYYPYNGCSNQELSVAFQGEYSSVQYVICPVGVHEGTLFPVILCWIVSSCSSFAGRGPISILSGGPCRMDPSVIEHNYWFRDNFALEVKF